MTRKENCVVRGLGHGMTRKVVCAGAQSINYLGPVVKPRDDKKDVIDITWVPWSASTHEN